MSGADADVARRVNDLLLPIVKGVGSERSYQYLSESLQTLGGSGYLKDYPIEQYVRDAKIDSLYEGTTAIQAQDFFFRKIARDRGVALDHVLGPDPGLRRAPGRPTRTGRVPRGTLATAAADVHAMVATLTGYFVAASTDPREVYRVGLQSVPFLLAVGDLLIGWLLLWHAEIALTALDGQPSERDRAFYRGKVTAATFFAANVLPRLSADRPRGRDHRPAAMELAGRRLLAPTRADCEGYRTFPTVDARQ